MSVTITRDEWMNEFERVMRQQPAGDPGLATWELAEMLGVGEHYINKMMRKALRSGRLKVGRKPGFAIDGRKIMVPCYQLVTAKAAKRR